MAESERNDQMTTEASGAMSENKGQGILDERQAAPQQPVQHASTSTSEPSMQGQPAQGQPVQGQPAQGQPVQGQPVQGQPAQGQPVQGQPVQGQPVQGQPVQGAGYPNVWPGPYPQWQQAGPQGGYPGWQPQQPLHPHPGVQAGPQAGPHPGTPPGAQPVGPSYGPGMYPPPAPQWQMMPQQGQQGQGAHQPKVDRHAQAAPGEDRYEDLKTASFYNEHYRKPGKGRMKGLVGPMIAIGLICSILGGVVTGGLLHFYGADFLGIGNSAAPIAQTASGDSTVRKVEILSRTDEPITAIAEKAGPSVVGINVEYTYNDSFFGTQNGGGQGSGIIISADGYILTNNHVVEAAANTGTSRKRFSNTGNITVVLPSHPDTPYEATIVGLDAKTDIAVIKIDAANLPVAEIGDSDALVVGELAVAIGNPAGLEYMGSVTSGIISGLNRKVDTGDGTMLSLIQTDAAISPGNSGGALLNAEGQVIGVNSSKIGGTSYEGLGFAIPIKDAMAIADSLMTDGFVVRPQIGVSIDNSFTADVAKANSVPEGVLVGEVMAGSPAENAGIQAYDIITAFNGVAVPDYDSLETQKNKFNPGDTVTLTVYRIPENAQPEDGESIEIQLTLGSTANSN